MITNYLMDIGVMDSEDVEIVSDPEDETLAVGYSITSYGLDFDVDGLIRRIERDDIYIPNFQRAFVWTQAISSRFIESLLLGLPVPGIFLYRAEGGKYEVIDGQQRLKTLQMFRSGKFNNRIFRLEGLESRFNHKSYSELLGSDRRQLEDSIIHATIIRQDAPDDSGSSKFSIFERINTSARPLSAQEIRSAIFQSDFNCLLSELNSDPSWRILFGKVHSRKRDEELILRFLALYYCFREYETPMKRFLNSFMHINQNLEVYSAKQISSLFHSTVHTILDQIGPKSFKLVRAVNAALCDSLMVGVARRLEHGPVQSGLQHQYDKLLNNEEFVSSISKGTSQNENVRRRIQLSTDIFSDAE